MIDEQHVPKLPNAPLQEVIFELRWKLDFDQETQKHIDKDFQFAFATFTTLASKTQKHKVSLKHPLIADNMLTNRPLYQYWTEKNQYPVFQLGPGVFTVNETEKNYEWNYFRKTIIEGIKWLTQSYSNKLELSFIELRYIDAIEVHAEYEKKLSKFIAENLNIEIHNKVVAEPLNDIQLHQRFRINSDNFLSLLIANGTKNMDQSQAIILQTSYSKTSNISLENLTDWIDTAHKTCSSLFKKMISKKLYEQFNKAN